MAAGAKSDQSSVRVVDNPEQNRFEVNVDGQLAVAEYRRERDRIIFTHTEVPDALEGHGVGSALAKGALDHARAQNLLVVPMCRFIAAYIRRHKEYQSLVAPAE